MQVGRGCCTPEGEAFATYGALDLHVGEVSGNPVGANVHDPGFDIARLTDQVVYRDNGRDLDATSLPLPAAPVPND